VDRAADACDFAHFCVVKDDDVCLAFLLDGTPGMSIAGLVEYAKVCGLMCCLPILTAAACCCDRKAAW
jgi:hypothetical protein